MCNWSPIWREKNKAKKESKEMAKNVSDTAKDIKYRNEDPANSK